ncbi:MAG: DNRLRE domain-containing protein [Chloroflexota bacterium]|nr:DNRLRE domain-containing protein [Chloroflexota bacterium]
MLFLLLVLIGGALGAPLSAVAGPVTATFTATEDTYLQESKPGATAGSSSLLEVDGKPVRDTLIRFERSGIGTGPVVGVKLRLYVVNASPAGGTVYLSAGGWSETTATWSNAPSRGSSVGSAGAVKSGAWVEIALPAALGVNGQLNVRIGSTNADGAEFASSEDSGGRGPQLIVSYEPATATPTPVPTATPTPVPTATPTPVPTVMPTATPTPVPTAVPTATPLAPTPTVAATATPSVTQVPSPLPSGDPVIVAAGDIACDPLDPAFNAGLGTGSACQQAAVASLAAAEHPDAVLTLGDTQYDDGLLTAFNASYGPSWGSLLSLTRPVPGNHDYHTVGALGYYGYFGAAAGDPAKGYYSYELGTWHVVALNSNCSSVGGCAAGSPQEAWLRADLQAHPTSCILAYWHHPRFSSGPHGSDASAQALWQALYDAHADVVLSGHDHDYERFAPMDAFGTRDQWFGIRQFVVGTGGKSHYAVTGVAPNSEVRDGSTFGVLRMTLRTGSYSWEFRPLGGTLADAGSAGCDDVDSTDISAPSAPPQVTAVATGAQRVDLTWVTATDDVGVTTYEIRRNGTTLTTTGPVSSYTDATVFPATSYVYEVRARDAAGNWSPFTIASQITTPTLPAEPPLFSDGFESRDLSAWTSALGLTVQDVVVGTGNWAGRATSTGAGASAYRQLAAPEPQLVAKVRFYVVSQGANSATLVKLRTGTGTSVIAIYRSSTGTLNLRNDASAITTSSGTVVTAGAWHTLEFRARVDAAAGQTEVWLDGTRIPQLTLTQSLGTAPFGRVQIGETTTGRTYDIAFDDVTVTRGP